jgi:hypothetical protein
VAYIVLAIMERNTAKKEKQKNRKAAKMERNRARKEKQTDYFYGS